MRKERMKLKQYLDLTLAVDNLEKDQNLDWTDASGHSRNQTKRFSVNHKLIIRLSGRTLRLPDKIILTENCMQITAIQTFRKKETL